MHDIKAKRDHTPKKVKMESQLYIVRVGFLAEMRLFKTSVLPGFIQYTPSRVWVSKMVWGLIFNMHPWYTANTFPTLIPSISPETLMWFIEVSSDSDHFKK